MENIRFKLQSMIIVLMDIISIMNKEDVYSVWKISDKNTKTPVPDVQDLEKVIMVATVVTVVSTIISQLDHTDTVVHSITDMMTKIQPDVTPVTQLVPNVKENSKLTVLPVSQVPNSSEEFPQVLVVSMMDPPVLSNVLKVGLYIKIIYVSEMIGFMKN
jgi:hypothetical protein